MVPAKHKPSSHNTRETKEIDRYRTPGSLKDHNAQAARFFKSKNHRSNRRQGNLISRQMVERLAHDGTT